MMNWNCFPATSFGAPPIAAIASNASRIGTAEVLAPALCAPDTFTELPVVVMARPRFSAHEDTLSRCPGELVNLRQRYIRTTVIPLIRRRFAEGPMMDCLLSHRLEGSGPLRL